MNKFSQLLIILLLFVLVSCSLQSTDDNFEPAEIPPNLQLYTTVFGQGSGLWAFDPNTLEVQDTLSINDPISISFSPDYSAVYTSDRNSETNIYYAYKIDKLSNNIIQTQEIWNPFIWLNGSADKLFSLGSYQGIQILDAESLEILHEEQTDLTLSAALAVSSPDGRYFYAMVSVPGQNGLAGLLIYDLKERSIKSIIPLTDDENRRSNMSGSYIDISPDGRNVYITVFNWQGGGGYGSFHVIDVEKEEQIFEAPCGGFAWLGVSPDGRHVYLSDPAGAPFGFRGSGFELIPTNTILRYDVRQKKMETFANGGSTFGLIEDNHILIVTSITVLPDSRSMYIRVMVAGKTEEGLRPSIIHVDTRTKELLNYYYLPPDPDGFVRSVIHQLITGRKPG